MGNLAFLTHLQYRSALEEWQSGNFVRRQFEAEKYTRIYTNIQNYIIDHLERDSCAEDGQITIKLHQNRQDEVVLITIFGPQKG